MLETNAIRARLPIPSAPDLAAARDRVLTVAAFLAVAASVVGVPPFR